jgi:hypothetical protein
MSWIEGSLKELDKQELATVDNMGEDILVIEDDNGVHEELFEEEAALCWAAIICWPKENIETRLVI